MNIGDGNPRFGVFRTPHLLPKLIQTFDTKRLGGWKLRLGGWKFPFVDQWLCVPGLYGIESFPFYKGLAMGDVILIFSLEVLESWMKTNQRSSLKGRCVLGVSTWASSIPPQDMVQETIHYGSLTKWKGKTSLPIPFQTTAFCSGIRYISVVHLKEGKGYSTIRIGCWAVTMLE